jgi:hypothetical protein
MNWASLTDKETAALLAGLELLDMVLSGQNLDDAKELIQETLTNCGELEEPSVEDIIALTERINTK